MKKSILVLSALIVASLRSYGIIAHPLLNNDHLLRENGKRYPAVIRIESIDKDGVTSGTGTYFIDPATGRTAILTAYHVVDHPESWAVLEDGNRYLILLKKQIGAVDLAICFINPLHDLGIPASLCLESTNAPKYERPLKNAVVAGFGNSLYAPSPSLAQYLFDREGIIITSTNDIKRAARIPFLSEAYTSALKTSCIMTTAEMALGSSDHEKFRGFITHGDSGGPILIEEDGIEKIVAVISCGLNHGTQSAFSSQDLKRIIQGITNLYKFEEEKKAGFCEFSKKWGLMKDKWALGKCHVFTAIKSATIIKSPIVNFEVTIYPFIDEIRKTMEEVYIQQGLW